MRTFAKLAAALFLGLMAAAANAHIDFVEARLLSLERKDDRWVLKMEIHSPMYGQRQEGPRRATVQIDRVPRCIYTKHLYLGTPEEYEQALGVIRAQIADGGIHRFGLNARQMSPKGDAFLAVNLRVGGFGTAGQTVWAIQPEVGLDLCPFKYDSSK
jgi:hypothetical protein